ncbi:elongator complex protein 6-like [Dermacentor variabilis]|uniref:elongator complex protein 6-like n=1 Tax=Dermacentor variabilis TaxID=34621 RepID=UPI003F5C4D2C
MFLELNTFLDFDNKVLPRRFVVISSDDMVEHAFVLNHMLMLYLKTGRRVFQLNFVNDDAFFASVCQKLGINLKTYAAKSAFYSFSCLKILKGLVKSSFSDSSHPFAFLTAPASEHGDDRLSVLRRQILDELRRFVGDDATKGEVLVLVDDVSSVLNFGLGHREIAALIHSLRVEPLVCERGTVVAGTKFCAREDDADCHRLCTYLSHLADATIDVRGLSTGHSRDITGQISMTRTSNTQLPTMKKMHFRLEDRGVKLFPVGLNKLPSHV